MDHWAADTHAAIAARAVADALVPRDYLNWGAGVYMVAVSDQGTSAVPNVTSRPAAVACLAQVDLRNPLTGVVFRTAARSETLRAASNRATHALMAMGRGGYCFARRLGRVYRAPDGRWLVAEPVWREDSRAAEHPAGLVSLEEALAEAADPHALMDEALAAVNPRGPMHEALAVDVP